jgi:hypothetical protein
MAKTARIQGIFVEPSPIRRNKRMGSMSRYFDAAINIRRYALLYMTLAELARASFVGNLSGSMYTR